MEKFPIITLTSDWKNSDYYIGSIKGQLLSKSPNVNIIDISHTIPPFNTGIAAFVLKNTYLHFPKETIHIICINTESSENYKNIIVFANNHYFIGTDNGIFSLILDDKPDKIVTLSSNSYETPNSFLTIFTSAAAHIIEGKKIDELGESISTLKEQIPLLPTIEESIIYGCVIYIDSYQNAITNISENLFNRVGKGREFEILISSNKHRIHKINTKYNETTIGELMAIFNSIHLLEIAICNGNAMELLNLSINSGVVIKFK